MNNENGELMKNLKSCLVLGFLGAFVGGGVISTSASCIINDKCINFSKQGQRWQVDLIAEHTDPVNSLEQTVNITFAKCYDDDDHALLSAADTENPAYLALRNDLLSSVQDACAEWHEKSLQPWINVK